MISCVTNFFSNEKALNILMYLAWFVEVGVILEKSQVDILYKKENRFENYTH